MTFLTDLSRLSDAATQGEWLTERRSFGYPKQDGGPTVKILDVRSVDRVPICGGTIADATDANMELIALLANRRREILALVEIATAVQRYPLLRYHIGSQLDDSLRDALAALDGQEGNT